MKRRTFLGSTALVTFALATPHLTCAQQTATAQATSAKPDILFLLVDDLGYSDVSWHGGQAKTPNIDSLLPLGARLEQFYVQPLCSPTRAALMTGRYPMRYGLQVGVVKPGAPYGLPLEERTLPQALQEGGYTTAMCGKWHLGDFQKEYWPNARGFDYWYGHLLGQINYFDHTRDGNLDWYRNGQPLVEEGYSTTLLGKDAASVIRRQPKDRPLFLYVPFNGVHAPQQAPESYKAPYNTLAPRARNRAGMYAAVDESVGQILKALDDTGRRKNTLIVFASDNGGPMVSDNVPLHGRKGTVYEGGVRSSGVVVWPGHVKPNSVINETLHVTDFYPTLLTIAGVSLDANEQKLAIDGRDMLPVLIQSKPSAHQEILLNTTPNGGALRVGDWKIVVTKANQELYNLRDDPNEKNNLAATQPEKFKELRDRYNTYAQQAMPPKNTEEAED